MAHELSLDFTFLKDCKEKKKQNHQNTKNKNIEEHVIEAICGQSLKLPGSFQKNLADPLQVQ